MFHREGRMFRGNNQRAGAIFRPDYQFEPLNVQTTAWSTQFPPLLFSGIRNDRHQLLAANSQVRIHAGWFRSDFLIPAYTPVLSADTLIKPVLRPRRQTARQRVTGSFINQITKKI